MPAPSDVTQVLAPRDIEVTLCGEDFTIAAAPAATWLSILAAAEPDGADILPGMLSDDQATQLELLLLTGELDVPELQTALQDIITVASGYRWYWTMKLLSLLRGQHATELFGELAHLNTATVSLGAWLSALYARVVKYQKQEDRVKLDMELDTPPAGVEIEISEAEQQATEQAFFGMMQGG